MNCINKIFDGQFQLPGGLRRGFAAARLLGLRIRTYRGHLCLSLVSVLSCQVEVLRWADHSSRGIIASVSYLNGFV